MATRHRRVVWSESATEALDAAIAYIAEDSPDTAGRVLKKVLTTASSLSTLAERGAPVPETDDPTVR